MIDEIWKSYFRQSIGNRSSKRLNRRDSSGQSLPIRNLLSSYTIFRGVRNELGSYTQFHEVPNQTTNHNETDERNGSNVSSSWAWPFEEAW